MIKTKICPQCGSINCYVFARTKAGTLRYKCRDCFKTFTLTKRGRPALGDKPLTPAERSRNYRQRKKKKKQ